MFLLLLFTPVLAFFGAVIRALVLFLPVMLVLMWIHPLIPIIPALGWKASFLLVMLIGLLFPGSATPSND